MILFVILAALLVALALLFVLPGLVQARGAAQPGPAAAARQPRTAWTLALALPIGSAALYALLGAPAAVIAPAQVAAHAASAAPVPLAAGQPAMTRAQIEGMVQRLADRLRTQPDDAAGWRMLAHSYETLERFGDAAQAYQQLQRLQPEDATLLADQAVALAMSQHQRLSGEPEKLIDRALALEPMNVQALALSGSAAYERRDYTRAADVWQRVLALVPPESEIAGAIANSIRKARSLAEAGRAAPRASGNNDNHATRRP